MEQSRREFLLLGLGGVSALIAGCVQERYHITERPGPTWSGPGSAGRSYSQNNRVTTPSYAGASSVTTPEVNAPSLEAPVETPVTPVPTYNITGPLDAIPRRAWAGAAPIAGKIQAMGSIGKITVHHEGWTEVYFDDRATTSARLESIRKSHLERLNAGDIGYHYIIDRAGRLWQGRDLSYQGAHVSEFNPQNIGIMCLGNFDKQRPTEAQLSTLRESLIGLQRYYRVPVGRVYTHQELRPTECPGTDLQARMVTMRRNGLA